MSKLIKKLLGDKRIHDEPTTLNNNGIVPKFIKNIMNVDLEKIKKQDSLIEIPDNMTTYIRCLFHDLRGPLNNISMGIDILTDNIDNSHPDHTILQTIQTSCRFLGDTLDGFLNLQDLNASSSSIVDIIKLNNEPFNIIGMINKIQMVLSFHALNKKIRIKYTYSDVNEWVIGDYKHIQHVIMNLLSNAIKFSEENKTILIDMNGELILNKYQTIRITIIDENKWIREEIKQKLFQENVTSDKTKGNGLGLYICKKIVDLHYGTILHEYNTCNPNKIGNVFKVTLKLLTCLSGSDKYDSVKNEIISSNLLKTENKNEEIFQDEFDISAHDILAPSLVSKPPPKQELGDNVSAVVIKGGIDKEDKHDMFLYIKKQQIIENIPPLLGSIQNRHSMKNSTNTMSIISNTYVKIAIVDDSDVSRKLMYRMFENNCKNIKLTECSDGLDCLIKLHAKIERVKLIMLDNIMPNITGVLLSKILRGLGFSGLIIGITGNGLNEDKQEFINAGADFVFLKPFNKKDLNRLLAFIRKYGYESVYGKVIIETADKTLEWG